MTKILAIDPGPERSGWIEMQEGHPIQWGHDANGFLKDTLANYDVLVIEDVSHYGKDISVGKDVFETCKWMGRFDEAYHGEAVFISRPDIKLHLLGLRRGNDAQVRQALIDKYGGNEVAIGSIKCKTCKGKGWNGVGRPECRDCHHVEENNRADGRDMGCGYEVHPGVLHGISGHVWSALAVATTYINTIADIETEVAL